MSILIITEEVSANMYSRELVQELLKKDEKIYLSSDIDFVNENVEIISSIPSLGSFGIIEVVKSLKKHYVKLMEIIEFVKREKPDSVIFLDYGGFNTILSQLLKNLSKLYYFIPPKVWVWGEFRAKILARNCESIFTIFPFETVYFEKYGGKAYFTGHPLMKLIRKYRTKQKKLNHICLMPGSRESEIAFSWKTISETAEKLQSMNKKYKFHLLVAEGVNRKIFEEDCEKLGINIITDEDERRKKLASSGLAIAVSGTAILEAALLSTPCVAMYCLQPLTMIIARNIVKTKYVALPNLILDKKIVPEFVNENVPSSLIFDECRKILTNKKSFNQVTPFRLQ